MVYGTCYTVYKGTSLFRNLKLRQIWRTDWEVGKGNVVIPYNVFLTVRQDGHLTKKLGNKVRRNNEITIFIFYKKIFFEYTALAIKPFSILSFLKRNKKQTLGLYFPLPLTNYVYFHINFLNKTFNLTLKLSSINSPSTSSIIIKKACFLLKNCL